MQYFDAVVEIRITSRRGKRKREGGDCVGGKTVGSFTQRGAMEETNSISENTRFAVTTTAAMARDDPRVRVRGNCTPPEMCVLICSIIASPVCICSS